MGSLGSVRVENKGFRVGLYPQVRLGLDSSVYCVHGNSRGRGGVGYVGVGVWVMWMWGVWTRGSEARSRMDGVVGDRHVDDLIFDRP